MSDSLEQYGTEVESWNGAGIGNRTTTFSIHEKNGFYTATGLIAGNYISQSFELSFSPGSGRSLHIRSQIHRPLP